MGHAFRLGRHFLLSGGEIDRLEVNVRSKLGICSVRLLRFRLSIRNLVYASNADQSVLRLSRRFLAIYRPSQHRTTQSL